jgi:hypothetical protein
MIWWFLRSSITWSMRGLGEVVWKTRGPWKGGGRSAPSVSNGAPKAAPSPWEEMWLGLVVPRLIGRR